MIKKIAIFTNILLFFLIVLLVGHIKKLDTVNQHYRNENAILIGDLQKKNTVISLQKSKIKNYNLISYRDSVIKKKYPAFSKIIEVVYKYSKKYEFSPDLVMSLIHIESGFKPNAVSSQGAYGLMQINFSVWKDVLKLDQKRIFDIEYNIDHGLKILKHYYDKSNGDIMRALHLYNNGYGYNNTAYKDKVVSTIYY